MSRPKSTTPPRSYATAAAHAERRRKEEIEVWEMRRERNPGNFERDAPRWVKAEMHGERGSGERVLQRV